MFCCVIINHFINIHIFQRMPADGFGCTTRPQLKLPRVLMRWHWGDLTQRSLEAPFNKTQFSNWGSQTKTNTHASIYLSIYIYRHVRAHVYALYMCIRVLVYTLACTHVNPHGLAFFCFHTCQVRIYSFDVSLSFLPFQLRRQPPLHHRSARQLASPLGRMGSEQSICQTECQRACVRENVRTYAR